MENTNKKDAWFRAKMFGLGWYPVSWQGWIVTILYITPIIQYAQQAKELSLSASDFIINFALPITINTVFLLIICYVKGERPRWRWGK